MICLKSSIVTPVYHEIGSGRLIMKDLTSATNTWKRKQTLTALRRVIRSFYEAEAAVAKKSNAATLE